MAQGLHLKGEFQRAMEICQSVIDDIKEYCRDDDVVQLMAVALGIMSESRESVGDVKRAVEYKKAQREFLEYIKESQADEEEEHEVTSPEVRKKRILRKLDSLQNMSLDPFDPQGSMEKILKSMEKAKAQKISDAMDSLSTSSRVANHEKTVMDWLFEHPLVMGLIVVAVMLLMVMVLIYSLTPRARPAAETEARMRELMKQFTRNMNPVNEKTDDL